MRVWKEWRWDREASLRTLLAYNAEDVLNMQPLAELAYRELSDRAGGPFPGPANR